MPERRMWKYETVKCENVVMWNMKMWMGSARYEHVENLMGFMGYLTLQVVPCISIAFSHLHIYTFAYSS